MYGNPHRCRAPGPVVNPSRSVLVQGCRWRADRGGDILLATESARGRGGCNLRGRTRVYVDSITQRDACIALWYRGSVEPARASGHGCRHATHGPATARLARTRRATGVHARVARRYRPRAPGHRGASDARGGTFATSVGN